MSVKIYRAKILNVSRSEYDLLMYNRKEKIDLTRFSPGSLVYHFDSENKIRKHEFHFYSGQPRQEGLGSPQGSSSG